MRLDVAAGTVGLLTARRVAERDEQLVALVVRGERDVPAAEVESQRPGAGKMLDLPVARLDVLVLARVGPCERGLEAHGRLGIEVAQAGERPALRAVERRVSAAREELVLHPSLLGEVHACATAAQASAFPP